MLREDIEKTREMNPKQRRDALKKYADKRGIGQMFALLSGARDRRAVLRAMADLAVLPHALEIIAHYAVIERALLESLLWDEDPKTRKTAAELAGRAAPEEFAEALGERLGAENTYFVLPSVILAIGRSERAGELLEGYMIPDCEEKQQRDIADALRKATAPKEAGTPRVGLLPMRSRLMLLCPSRQVTRRELTELGIGNADCPGRMGAVFADGLERFEDVLGARTFYSASVYLGRDPEFPAVDEAMSMLFGENTLYRIELTSDTRPLSGADRRQETSRIAGRIKGHTNSTSAYTCTLMVHRTPKGDIYSLRPSDALDTRFSWRKAAVSASIHPAAAAAVVYFAREWLKEGSVLDCFCGAGTMLYERARFPYRSLTGTDVSEEALTAARRNERSARRGVRFVKKNALAPFRETFDEVICNMPFGVRVSDHTANRHLYREFTEQLPEILNPGGTAVLFTQEKELITKCLRHHEELELCARHTFAAGGLYPTAYIVRRAK